MTALEGYSAPTSMIAVPALPRVSVITISKNNINTIRRCVESVLLQDYPNLEYIIQDGVSTDGTLEFLRGFTDPRIKLVSEPDTGGSHAYFKGLKRCTGDLVTLCWSDEELLPGVVGWGADQMRLHPDVAAIYGNVYPTDVDGNILPSGAEVKPWDPKAAHCWEMMPNYVGSFMRMDALRESGFFEFTDGFYREGRSGPGETNCIMYDYFAKVGVRKPVLRIPRYVGKFFVHGGQLSSTANVLREMIPTLYRSFDHLCDSPGAPEWIRGLRGRAYAGFHLAMINSLIANAGDYEEAKRMLREALRYEPDISFLDHVVLESCGFFLIRNQPQDAYDMVRPVIDAGHRRPPMLYAYAVAAIDLGVIEEALVAVEEGLALDPRNKVLGELHPHLRKDREALRSLEAEMSRRLGELRAGDFKAQLADLARTQSREKLRRRLFRQRRKGTVEELLVMRHSVLKALEKPGLLPFLRKDAPESATWLAELLQGWLDVATEAGAGELQQALARLLIADRTADAAPGACLPTRA